ncbi:MAG: Lrp/AsnC family transcriptional regulator [Actinomycetota bacterium]|nr:Lrp/AsnC family transcriptional regulator [Actinomycetota bacterium]
MNLADQARPKDVQPLDDVDARILAQLMRDGRIPNNALAARVGVAASTALARVRALVDRGVVRGFTADVDPAAVGCPVQAIVALRLRTHDAPHVLGFAARVAQLPEVIQTFHVSGTEDFLVHVAVADPAGLRSFVLTALTSDPSVGQAQTHLVFEHQRGHFLQRSSSADAR